MAAKTHCPITRKQFAAHAKGVEAVIDGQKVLIPTKEFSTNSLGWYANGKTVITVDGVPCTVQIGVTLTIVGSKELPKE